MELDVVLRQGGSDIFSNIELNFDVFKSRRIIFRFFFRLGVARGVAQTMIPSLRKRPSRDRYVRTTRYNLISLCIAFSSAFFPILLLTFFSGLFDLITECKAE